MNNAEINKEPNIPENNIEPKLEEQYHAQPRQDVDIFRNTFMRYMGELHLITTMHWLWPLWYRLQQWGWRGVPPASAQNDCSCLLRLGRWICLHGHIWQVHARTSEWLVAACRGHSCWRCVYLANAGLSHNTWSGYQSVRDDAGSHIYSLALLTRLLRSITATTRSMLSKAPSYMAKTLPTVIGLASIPLIVHPIDKLVDRIMDSSYRKRNW